MKKNEIQILDKTELKKLKGSIVGVKYNKITTGPHKGLYEAIAIVNQEGIPMSIWTKEQEDYLDKRFLPLETRLTSVEKRLTSVETRLTSVETRLTSVETRLTSVESKLSTIESKLNDIFVIVQELTKTKQASK